MDPYFFIQGLDSIDGDITRINLPENPTQNIPPNLRNTTCFNTLGYFKGTINQLKPSSYFRENDGLYVKNILHNFKIRVVNLDRRTDRWDAMRKKLSDAGIKNFERFSAVDGQRLQMNDELKYLFRNNDFNYRQGVVGCALSHLRIWEELLASKEDYVIVTEDDIELASDFASKLNVVLHNILQKPYTEMAFLGHFLWNGRQPVLNDYPNFEKINIPDYMGGFYGYIISKGGAWKLLQIAKFYGIQNGIDRFAHIHFDKMSVFTCVPNIIHSDFAVPGNDVNSDIQRNHNPVGVLTSLSSVKNDKKYTRIKLITDWTSSAELVKKWSKMSKNNDGVWNDIKICSDNDADHYVIINRPGPYIEYYDPKKTIVTRMEPWVFDESKNWGAHTWGKWAKPDAKRFRKILTHDVHPNFGEWHLNKTYEQLLNREIGSRAKTRIISTIISDKNFDEGHIKRLEFLNYLESKEEFDIDIYGRGNHSFKNFKGALEHKDEGLEEYKYTICVENNSEHNYFTEKLIDGILSECLCFYWGCPNLNDYLPENSYIRLDLNDYEASYEQIKNAILNDEWSKRIDSIREAKMKILNELQVFPTLEKIIKELS